MSSSTGFGKLPVEDQRGTQYEDAVRGDPIQRPKRGKKSSVEVTIERGGNLDGAIKRFGKMTADVVREAKQRARFRARPTRSARRRRGKLLEKRRATFEEVPK